MLDIVIVQEQLKESNLQHVCVRCVFWKYRQFSETLIKMQQDCHFFCFGLNGFLQPDVQSVQRLREHDTRLNVFTGVVKLYRWEIDLLKTLAYGKVISKY